ncbi:hypothetical protein [uncultured Bartonella sp.]|uniref:hypothetical protein n=1 Tax=uncultured Bartonella sp. TaxID=104108 RepID=UPI00262B429A|nr:hypothetical protein [uncultured Bartonella sp.]
MVIAIRKIFWPLLTVLIFVGVMAIWFKVGSKEKNLANDLAAMSHEISWLSYDIDGFDVTLHGFAPNKATRDNVVKEVQSFKNIGNVVSDIILLSDQTNNYLMFIVDEDGITVRGTIPVGVGRFRLINLISNERPGVMVYDELETGVMMPETFDKAFNYFLTILPEMETGVIEVKNGQVTTDYATLDKLKENSKLPEGMVLDTTCVWQRPQGGYWQNSCAEKK